jgi:RND superfamily putative drug exporter
MFSWAGRTVIRFRRAILVLGALAVIVGVAVGGSAFGRLAAGGFDDPRSQSTTAAKRIAAELGRQAPDVVALYTDRRSATAASGRPSSRSRRGCARFPRSRT